MKSLRRNLPVIVLLAVVFSAFGATLWVVASSTQANQEKAAGPPADQTHIGTKQCAACHFEQFIAWKKTKHAKAFDDLSAKYKQDASCLKCHTTGFGEPTGYKDVSTSQLAGVSCEACHGPGSKHAEVSKQFANKKKLTKEEEQIARGSTHKILPGNACANCHLAQGHQVHPEYEKEKK